MRAPALAVAAVLVLAAGWLLLRAADRARPTLAAPVAARAEPPAAQPASVSPPAEDPLAEATGVVGAPSGRLLPPLIGEPGGSFPPLCDESSWSGVASLVQRVGEGEAHVDAAAWERLDTSARIGVASWLSKCRLEGQPVRVVGAASGELLAHYDGAAGYRPGEPSGR